MGQKVHCGRNTVKHARQGAGNHIPMPPETTGISRRATREGAWIRDFDDADLEARIAQEP